MLIVTGTQGSGSAIWLHILASAGFSAYTDAPLFSNGIYFATNPDPKTGRYVFPEQVEERTVHVSIPGLVRTDRAYIGRVLASVCDVREYVASMQRLRELSAFGAGCAPARLPAAFEWWLEVHALVRDVSTRRYAAHVETYGRLLRDPERVIHEVLAWIGRGDAESAARVQPVQPSPERAEPVGIESDTLAVFDELYRAIDERAGISASLIGKLNDTHQLLLPHIRAEEAELARTAVTGP